MYNSTRRLYRCLAAKKNHDFPNSYTTPSVFLFISPRRIRSTGFVFSFFVNFIYFIFKFFFLRSKQNPSCRCTSHREIIETHARSESCRVIARHGSALSGFPIEPRSLFEVCWASAFALAASTRKQRGRERGASI